MKRTFIQYICGKAPKVGFLIISFLFFEGTLFAQTTTIDWQWHNEVGSTGEDFGEKVIMDDDGNIYMTMQFTNTVDVDPGASTTNLVSAGGLDVAIVCYNSSGDFQWAKQFGGTGEDRIWEIKWKDDYLYVAGSFSNTVDFDPGPGTDSYTSAGNLDIFFGKYEDDGDHVWVNTMGGTDRDEGWAIDINSEDDVIIACGFRSNTVDFDPGTGTTNLVSAGNYDMVIGKYSNNGDLIWVERMEGLGMIFFYTLDLDDQDNLFVGGFFRNTVDFDPGAGTQNRTAVGNWDLVIASYDSSGAYRWANTTGGSAEDRAYSVVVSDDGDVYCTGWFTGTNIDFDPGPGTTTISSSGGSDIFLVKYQNDGDLEWVNSIGSTGTDGGYCIYVDSVENVYAVGQFTGTNVDFDPDVSGTANLTSSSTDMFLAKYDSSGNYTWARNPSGANAADNLRGIWVNESDEAIYVTGHFGSTVNFNVESGTQNATSSGSYDLVLAKYLPDIGGVLPIELIYFDAKYNDETGDVKLEWVTATEINNAYFTLEHSTNGVEWTEIGRVSGAGNSNTSLYYEYFHPDPVLGDNYYRLMQTDYDGQFEIFEPKVVHIETKQEHTNLERIS